MRRDLTDAEVARVLGKHPRTIQRWCNQQKLPGAYRSGRSWRIPRSALRAAQLARAFRASDGERELRAAMLRCHELQAEIEDIKRSGPGAVRSDWPRLVRELDTLASAIEGLPRDLRQLPGWMSRR